MSIEEIIAGHPEPLSVKPEDGIRAAARIMAEKRIGFLLLLKPGGGLAGVVSERDIVRDVAHGETEFGTRPVSEIATTSVQTCAPEDDPHDVFDRMNQGKFRHMPVERGGAIVGVVSMSDLLRHFEKAASPEAKAAAFQAFFEGGAVPGA